MNTTKPTQLILSFDSLFKLPYYIDGDVKITQSNAVSVGMKGTFLSCIVYELK